MLVDRRLLAATIAAGALAIASGCAPTGRHARTGPVLEAKPDDCAILVALDNRLDRPYEVVGLVEAEGTTSFTTLIPILQQEACALGADALINLSQALGSGYNALAQSNGTMAQGVGTSYSTYHATATAVRFTAAQ